MELLPASSLTYAASVARAMATRFTIAQSLDSDSVIPGHWRDAILYLTDDGASGFAIVKGDLRGVFSTVPGRGDALVSAAVNHGAITLDHFDSGPLSALYERHGFCEVRREANWTPGGPDVIYRSRH